MLLAAAACGQSVDDLPGVAGPAAADPRIAGRALAERAAAAHGQDAWHRHETIEAALTVQIAEHAPLKMMMFLDTACGRVRLELSTGEALVHDGARAWVWPADAEVPHAWEHLHTWGPLLALPFTLDRPGLNLTATGAARLRGERYEAAQLVDEPVGEGDADDATAPPSMLLADPATGIIEGVVMELPFVPLPSAAPATEPPTPELATPAEVQHVIHFRDFAMLNGLVLPLTWTIHPWWPGAPEIAEGAALGRVTIDHVDFARTDPRLYLAPYGSRELHPPEPPGVPGTAGTPEASKTSEPTGTGKPPQPPAAPDSPATPTATPESAAATESAGLPGLD